MNIVLSVLAVFARLVKPSQGVHTSPFGYIRELLAEIQRRRASRVRKFAETLPYVAELPRVPAPRAPVDALPRTALSAARPVVDPRTVAEPAAIVRPGYRQWEAREAQRRTDRDRLALAVLMDVASAASREGVA